MQTVMFATGIECSYPTVENGKRRDQLEETRHYEYWREDFELCKEIGARYVRYGPPYYRMHTGAHSYDWSFTDEVLPVMREMDLVPILDLCHFGVPDWVGDFQNTDWPELFADFAEAFAERYPWIAYYTPVNEILICARFSGKEGIWNEQQKSDRAMITAHANMCRATLLATERILKHRPDAVFFQSETTEVFYEQWPETRQEVAFHNQLRFLTFDFLYGHPPTAEILLFLMENGVEKENYRWFMEHGRRAAPHCVMGMDYYSANERLIHPDGREQEIGPVLGWHTIAVQYYQRYRKPMMLTETNTLDPAMAPDWLWKTWHNAARLRRDGVPVVGFTWYSLQDQVD
ncbi:MAG TPA: family 1 glycosylhydrolase, partial [Chloroflexota bacterium]|nr:family 1 glycosylhydrolase [Chloroflexota bacterium]